MCYEREKKWIIKTTKTKRGPHQVNHDSLFRWKLHLSAPFQKTRQVEAPTPNPTRATEDYTYREGI